MFWNTETDNVKFKFTLKQKKMTRRGLLSIISPVYDPLGLVAPFLLQGRLLNQDLRRANLGWDEVIPEKIQMVQRLKILWQTELNLSKIIQMNPSGILSLQNRTQQIAYQEGLMFVMMIKLKGGTLDCTFFGNQRQLRMTTK